MRTLDLIEFVVARPAGAMANEIAATRSIPVSSLSYLLATLVERDYLRREGRQYHAGAGLQRLRGPVGNTTLADRAVSYVKALHRQFNETVSLFARSGWQAEAIATETASQPLRYAIDVGTFVPLHCIAGGKAILATLSADDLEHYFNESKRERFTEHTHHTRKALMRDIDIVRATGVAIAHEEYAAGIAAVSVAIGGPGAAGLALSVAAPSLRMTVDTESRIIRELRIAAAALVA